jgi:CheY-like chemotaxis protein
MEKKRILIVDDERSMRQLVAEVLGSQNYNITMADNGVEAIQQIDKAVYDLIITDYMMPEMDGLELTCKIKARYPLMPVLVVTGEAPVQDLLENGAAACIMKPFDIFELRSSVKTILDRGMNGIDEKNP